MSNPTNESVTFAFYGDGHQNTRRTVKAIQTSLVIGAILAGAIGVIVLTWTNATVAILGVLLGLYFVVRGVVRLVSGLLAPGLTPGGRTLSIILGILLVVVGVFALKNLMDSVALLGILIGLSWIIDGIATLVEASSAISRGFAITAGIISVIAGVVVLFVPIEGVAVLTMIAGIFLIIIAIAQIVGAFVLGSNLKKNLA